MEREREEKNDGGFHLFLESSSVLLPKLRMMTRRKRQ